MQPLLILNVNRVRLVRPSLRNEEMSRVAVRERNRHAHALHRAVGRHDRVGKRARHSVLLLDLLGTDGLGVPARRE